MPRPDMTLAEAVQVLYYGASCNTCRETRRIDLQAMLERLGPDFLVDDLRPRLRCARCGRKDVISVMLWKDATATERMMEHWK